MKNKRGLGCLLSGLLGILAICAVAGGWVLWRFNTREPRIFVEIRDPQSTIPANINEPLPLVASATADETIQRVEIYADGVLIAASNGDGQNIAMLSQTWTPLTTGRHVLVARAFLTAEQFADSEVIFVDILDLSAVPIQINVDDIPRANGVTEISVNDLAAAAGTTPEEIVRLNPGLESGRSVPPSSTVSLPRLAPDPSGSGAPSIPPPAPGAPGTAPLSDTDPNFEGETHSCSQIAIRWTDAPDETAYRIYRVAPGESVMSLLATLPANTTTYNDTPITRIGTYRYFLAPVRSSGESIVSMLVVEITPDCSPAGSASLSPDLRLSLISLTAQVRYDGVYCYVSVNGSRYERIPSGDGLLRATSGDLVYDLPLQLPNRGQYSIAPAATGLVMLEGECWGRRGAESQRIGHFSGSHASPEWDGRDLTSELAFEPLSLASLNNMPHAAGGANFLRYRIAPPISLLNLANLYNGVV
ncbi:MAG: Ig-like domain-containing protein [Chloroflexi bacterium]|nr:Ig-like domain-containing protein [Chloroflexota bacterium]